MLGVECAGNKSREDGEAVRAQSRVEHRQVSPLPALYRHSHGCHRASAQEHQPGAQGARRRRQQGRLAHAELERLDLRRHPGRGALSGRDQQDVRHQHPRQLPARRRTWRASPTSSRPNSPPTSARMSTSLLGASPQITPLVKIDFFERVDWKQYLPDRITDQMIELDGRIIRIVTGLSGATYNSRARADEADAARRFPASRNGRARSPRRPTPPASTCSMPTDVWGKEKTVDYVTKLSSQITGLIRCGEAERIATGEYLALVMDCTGQDALQWQEKGAPLGQMMPLDAAQQRYYYFAVPKNAQHPNAAKLYTVFHDDRGRPEARPTRPGRPTCTSCRARAWARWSTAIMKQNVHVQGSHGRVAAAASRDQRRPQRADQDSDDRSEMLPRPPSPRLLRSVATAAQSPSAMTDSGPPRTRLDARLRGHERRDLAKSTGHVHRRRTAESAARRRPPARDMLAGRHRQLRDPLPSRRRCCG